MEPVAPPRNRQSRGGARPAGHCSLGRKTGARPSQLQSAPLKAAADSPTRSAHVEALWKRQTAAERSNSVRTMARRAVRATGCRRPQHLLAPSKQRVAGSSPAGGILTRPLPKRNVRHRSSRCGGRRQCCGSVVEARKSHHGRAASSSGTSTASLRVPRPSPPGGLLDTRSAESYQRGRPRLTMGGWQRCPGWYVIEFPQMVQARSLADCRLSREAIVGRRPATTLASRPDEPRGVSAAVLLPAPKLITEAGAESEAGIGSSADPRQVSLTACCRRGAAGRSARQT